MYNTEGFDKLYRHIMKDYPDVKDDALLKEIFWITFSDLTPGMRPNTAEMERRLKRFIEGSMEYLDGVKIMSALCGVPVYKLVNGEGQDAVCQINIEGGKCLAFPVYSDPAKIGDEFGHSGLMAVGTSIFHIMNYIEENSEIEGIILNPGTADFAIKAKDIEDFFVNFSTLYGFFEECLSEGIPDDYLFPMVFSWFDDRDVEIFFKDETFCDGHVTELIYGDLGDCTALRVRANDGSYTIAGIDEITCIRALPAVRTEEDMEVEESLTSLKEAMEIREGVKGKDEDTDSMDPYDTDDTDGGKLN
ncbi:MAG: hypothetical protein LUD51_05705 [Clostridia bacterium]|nr:hypothetical protein [Clostridia bacterium]